MSIKGKYHSSLISVIGIIGIAALCRFVPHPPNFTPIAAMALFGGAYLGSRKAATLVIFAAMLLSDLFLGLHPLMPVVYGSLFLTILLGEKLGQNYKVSSLVGASLMSSVLFFVTTNLAEWAVGTLYPKTFVGLSSCFTAAIPFFQNSLMGDLFFTAMIFGAYRLFVISRFPALASARSA